MYLEEATVQSLLGTAAGMSPEGSAFVGLSITGPVLERLRARKLAAAAGAATGGRQGQSLMDTWVFGCPQDPTQVGGWVAGWLGGWMGGWVTRMGGWVGDGGGGGGLAVRHAHVKCAARVGGCLRLGGGGRGCSSRTILCKAAAAHGLN